MNLLLLFSECVIVIHANNQRYPPVDYVLHDCGNRLRFAVGRRHDLPALETTEHDAPDSCTSRPAYPLHPTLCLPHHHDMSGCPV